MPDADLPEIKRTVDNLRGAERHFQSAVMTALAGICGWMALTVQAQTVQMAALTEKVIYLEHQLDARDRNNYTASDAAKDFRLRDEVTSNLAARVLTLETRRTR
jgi:predicted metal-dependent HD superfamily phosphohydrolase